MNRFCIQYTVKTFVAMILEDGIITRFYDTCILRSISWLLWRASSLRKKIRFSSSLDRRLYSSICFISAIRV